MEKFIRRWLLVWVSVGCLGYLLTSLIFKPHSASGIIFIGTGIISWGILLVTGLIHAAKEMDEQ